LVFQGEALFEVGGLVFEEVLLGSLVLNPPRQVLVLYFTGDQVFVHVLSFKGMHVPISALYWALVKRSQLLGVGRGLLFGGVLLIFLKALKVLDILLLLEVHLYGHCFYRGVLSEAQIFLFKLHFVLGVGVSFTQDVFIDILLILKQLVHFRGGDLVLLCILHTWVDVYLEEVICIQLGALRLLIHTHLALHELSFLILISSQVFAEFLVDLLEHPQGLSRSHSLAAVQVKQAVEDEVSEGLIVLPLEVLLFHLVHLFMQFLFIEAFLFQVVDFLQFFLVFHQEAHDYHPQTEDLALEGVLRDL
jgi:hypothetical protein